MEWAGMVIIGQWSSQSTFSANNQDVCILVKLTTLVHCHPFTGVKNVMVRSAGMQEYFRLTSAVALLLAKYADKMQTRCTCRIARRGAHLRTTCKRLRFCNRPSAPSSLQLRLPLHFMPQLASRLSGTPLYALFSFFYKVH